MSNCHEPNNPLPCDRLSRQIKFDIQDNRFKRQGKFLDCLPACQEIIRQHKSILFFPEGTRSATGTLQPFKLGLGMLAVKLNVPIVPTLVQGTYRALPKGKYLPKRYPIRVTFGSPVKCDRYLLTHNLGHERQIYREIVNAVALEVQNLAIAV
jgi:1-acyl-sn-glycerol-3-phosphate acyltransferase